VVAAVVRDHAEVGDIVRWPADSAWAWQVCAVIVACDGERFLAISRGEAEADIVTRVVTEAEVASNNFVMATDLVMRH
jgi:hypothetical protein